MVLTELFFVIVFRRQTLRCYVTYSNFILRLPMWLLIVLYLVNTANAYQCIQPVWLPSNQTALGMTCLHNATHLAGGNMKAKVRMGEFYTAHC